MHYIAEATWQCGDPGMQYDTTINRWHTSKNTARINASNPCSEYMFLDDSACNLASFNLLKFVTPGGQFDIPAYRHAIGIVTTAMEIIVDSAGYPTEMIAKNSHDYRPLGLGYANLGALLMSFGLPYDSDAGRDFAGALTAILCGDAYWQSARIAETCPPLGAATPLTQQAQAYRRRLPRLLRQPRALPRRHPHAPRRGQQDRHSPSRHSDEPFQVPQLDELIAASKHAWDGALAHGERHGYRNSQVTVLAPTGTIGFMMDCDTTGVEPDLALVKYKKLVGGGMIKIVNNTVPSALIKLGYTDAEMHAIVSYIDATGTIEGAPDIKPEHLAVFDCSFKPAKGTRSIHYMGHIKMMAATQPFLSGAISKTVNLPNDCSVDDVAEAYMEAWRQGIKAVAIYRDGSKGTQPLNVSAPTTRKRPANKAVRRQSLPTTALSKTRRRRTSKSAKPSLAELGAGLTPIDQELAQVRADHATILETQHTRISELEASSHLQTAPPKTPTPSTPRSPPAPSAIASPPSAPPSPTSSRSPATRATSPSASTPTAAPAKSSSAWPRKAPPSPASWTPSPPPSRSPSSTASPSRSSPKSSPTPASSPPAGPATSRSATPNPSWITSSAGCRSASSTAPARPLRRPRPRPEPALHPRHRHHRNPLRPQPRRRRPAAGQLRRPHRAGKHTFFRRPSERSERSRAILRRPSRRRLAATRPLPPRRQRL